MNLLTATVSLDLLRLLSFIDFAVSRVLLVSWRSVLSSPFLSNSNPLLLQAQATYQVVEVSLLIVSVSVYLPSAF